MLVGGPAKRAHRNRRRLIRNCSQRCRVRKSKCAPRLVGSSPTQARPPIGREVPCRICDMAARRRDTPSWPVSPGASDNRIRSELARCPGDTKARLDFGELSSLRSNCSYSPTIGLALACRHFVNRRKNSLEIACITYNILGNAMINNPITRLL